MAPGCNRVTTASKLQVQRCAPGDFGVVRGHNRRAVHRVQKQVMACSNKTSLDDKQSGGDGGGGSNMKKEENRHDNQVHEDNIDRIPQAAHSEICMHAPGGTMRNSTKEEPGPSSPFASGSAMSIMSPFHPSNDGCSHAREPAGPLTPGM